MPTDILMALLKEAVASRTDLKVIIMSATMEAEKFTAYFGTAETFEFTGRVHPVEIQYLTEATPDYIHLSLNLVNHIHHNEGDGDILLFLTSVDQIERVCSRLRLGIENLEVLPLYSALTRAEQQRVFDSSSLRKCVVTTNIAETSLTIDGIVYVIGVEKHAGYNPRTGLKTLRTAPISKASARQRAGRAGRTGPGVCYRLYTEQTFKEIFIPNTIPGILDNEITSEILLLKTIGYHNVAKFDFIDHPHRETFFRGLQDLRALGYLNDNGAISETGRLAAKLPTHPAWYKAIVEGHKLNCSDDIISLAALNSTQNSIFARPHKVRYVADLAHKQFACSVSDHISQLNALHAYVRVSSQGKVDMDMWCFEAFLDRSTLDEVIQIRIQLKNMAERLLQAPLKAANFGDPACHTNIRKALARSFFYRSAIYSDKGDDIYATVHDNWPAGIHPESSLVGVNHEWVIFGEFVHTGRQYIQNITAVDPDWLIDLEYFQDFNLAQKGGNKGLRQPNVKASLDKARAQRANAGI
ncbi:putative pre-mrna splicing factor rna helicase protein [Ilyonectria robusta]